MILNSGECARCGKPFETADGDTHVDGNQGSSFNRIVHFNYLVCFRHLSARAERAESALAALDWQPGSEPPPHPGQYEVASRRDRFNGLGERAPGAGPWFYEHRYWTGERWMAGDAAAAVLWWRVVPPTPEEGQTG
jgi:hypothetical protein